ncbi:DUF3553 domain-containing protein [Geomonas sp. Red69]|uniref:DUF3553 domain-containing protein n=1 Tax=Geomonas diazotrophica TaxID=2843197 RepID=A0ABX8JK82_9BACT|nr:MULTISPECIES: DUF3553 domain-containing protein [Geomonas]MBU5636898.1 DUF3553 domain-containing protein [Geomonas diazotrophica]QWV98794.1 DUF3553 domain-containing protein [Geomonas nitrogeniifigens]QXE87951.1 DUF3553 domain-containing protein [Geomonas nitrogeniifigens]
MSIKRGDVVSHCGASQWGVGKVVEVFPTRVTIHFNDGVVRKIVSSHLGNLQPAEPGSFQPVRAEEQKAPQKAALPRVKKSTALPKEKKIASLPKEKKSTRKGALS